MNRTNEDTGKDQGALQSLFWRDEILQIMFWLEGESLADLITVDMLCTFLPVSPAALQPHLDACVAHQFLDKKSEPDAVTQYLLTETGRKEAARRFSDAFQGMQKVGHGECGPECDCNWEGHDACSSHYNHKH